MFRGRISRTGLGGYGGLSPSVNPRFFGHSQFGGYRRYGGYGEVGASTLLLAALVI